MRWGTVDLFTLAELRGNRWSPEHGGSHLRFISRLLSSAYKLQYKLNAAVQARGLCPKRKIVYVARGRVPLLKLRTSYQIGKSIGRHP